jgi:hypothetical protein
MSREFGEYYQGYFHDRIRQCIEDCEHGRDPLTKAWANFFRALAPVACSIASSEAFDSTPSDPILMTIEKLPKLKSALAEVEEFVGPYQDVAQEAIRRLSREKGL